MNEQIQPIVAKRNYAAIQGKEIQSFIMGSTLVGLNLILMLSLGAYWISPTVHQYISGKPF